MGGLACCGGVLSAGCCTADSAAHSPVPVQRLLSPGLHGSQEAGPRRGRALVVGGGGASPALPPSPRARAPEEAASWRGWSPEGAGVHPGRHGFLADAPCLGPDRAPAQRWCQGCYRPRAAPRLGPNPEGAGPRVMPAFSLTFQTRQKKLRHSSSRRKKVRPSHKAWEPLGRGAGPRGGAGCRAHSSVGKGW